jgi:hypothetical protein
MDPDESDNQNDTPIIGMQFFSGAYLMVDLDSNTFTLWQANATTDSNLVSVGGSCSETPAANSNTTVVPSANGTSSSNTTTGGGNSINPDQWDPAKDSSLSSGAIAGIAVGSVAGVASIAALALLLIFKRRRATKARGDSSLALTEAHSPADKGALRSLGQGGWYYGQPPGMAEPMSESVNEMAAGQTDRHELAEQVKPMEMAGGDEMRYFEMPATRTPKLRPSGG